MKKTTKIQKLFTRRRALLLVAAFLMSSTLSGWAQVHTYDARNRLISTYYPGSALVSNEFDPGRALISYAYDPAGNIMSTAISQIGEDLDGDKIPDSWEFRYFGTTGVVTSLAENPDGDEAEVAEELAFGLNPNGPNDPAQFPSMTRRPNGDLEITYTRARNVTGISFDYRISTNLQYWFSGTVDVDYEEVSVVDQEDGTEVVTIRLLKLGSEPRIFLRVKALFAP